jgi:hypothetical protein
MDENKSIKTNVSFDAAAGARTAEARGDGVGMFPIFPAAEDQAPRRRPACLRGFGVLLHRPRTAPTFSQVLYVE